MRTATLRALLLIAVLAPLVLVAVFTPEAMACPFCDGGPAGVNEVRDGIFDDNFWPRVAATLAPFPILGGIVALIYFGPPSFRRARTETEGQGSGSSSQPR